jgi:hypothetical protein
MLYTINFYHLRVLHIVGIKGSKDLNGLGIPGMPAINGYQSVEWSMRPADSFKANSYTHFHLSQKNTLKKRQAILALNEG